MNSAYLTVKSTSICVIDQSGKVLETVPCGNAAAAGKLLAIIAAACPNVSVLHFGKPDYAPTARNIAQLLKARAMP